MFYRENLQRALEFFNMAAPFWDEEMIIDKEIIRSRDEQRKSEHASRFRDACFKRADLRKGTGRNLSDFVIVTDFLAEAFCNGETVLRKFTEDSEQGLCAGESDQDPSVFKMDLASVFIGF